MLIKFSILEVHYLAYFLIIVFYYSKVSKNLFNVISFLIVILIIAFFSSIFQSKTFYNFIKDFSYFLKPIVAIVAGYLIAKKIKNVKRFLEPLIYITFFFALNHIILILIKVDLSTSSVTAIRNVGGISNLIEVFVLILLIGSYRYEFLNVIQNKLLKKVILSIIFISFILYFSRTMFITLIILLLSIYGYLKITAKGLKYGLISLLAFGLFYAYLFSQNFERAKPGLESFLYKMKIAPSEIFEKVDKSRMNDHVYLWDHWRAYEATVALEQINTIPTFIMGKGLGSLVDLEIKVFLGSEYMRYIPILHNGYINLFFKTGILGVIFYFLFILNLYLYSFSKTNQEETKIINNLIAGIGVYFLFSSLIINGAYNNEELYIFVLGFLLFFKKDFENKLSIE